MPRVEPRAMQAPLPRDPVGWWKYLHREFTKTGNRRAARALFQLLLLGEFNGADVFGVGGPCADCDVPEFNKYATISFGVGGKEPTPRWLYFEIIASLVKRGVQLSDLLPANFRHEAWIEPFADTLIAKPETHVCWNLARSCLRGDMDALTVEQMHAFLILWAFWVVSNHASFARLEVDLLQFQPTIQNVSNFVVNAP